MFALILELFIYLEDFRLQLSSTTIKSKLYFERNVVYFYKTQKALKKSFKVRIIDKIDDINLPEADRAVITPRSTRRLFQLIGYL
jgi:hypothetical protein